MLLSTGAGRQFYVAPGGSNSADGSAQHPWATIQHAADLVAPGDTVHVAPGRYSAAVTTNTSGTAGARIRFISDTPWGAKIDVTRVTSVWTNNGDYVDIQGFDITSPDPTTSGARSGIENDGNYARIVGNHVHDLPATAGLSGGMGGAGIASGYYTAGPPPGRWRRPWRWSRARGRRGVTFSSGTQIIGNVVHNIGPTTKTSLIHGIYLRDYGEQVWNNISYNNSGLGIHLWHAASNGTIANNLVFGNLDGGIAIGAGDSPGGITCDNCVVSNNIAINNGDYGISEHGLNGPNNVYLNNCVYGNSVAGFRLQGTKVDRNTVTADAQFVNYQADGPGDYHLRSGSPCINAGTSQGAPAQNYDGISRPQGAGVNIGPN